MRLLNNHPISVLKDIYKIVLKFTGYYNDKKIEMMNVYNAIQDITKELNIEFDNVLKLFKNKFINNNICVSSTKNDFFEYDYYADIIIKFNELPYNIKELLSEFLNFDKKYDRKIYLEICNLISCQVDKVTKSFEILSENDLEIVLNEKLKTMNSNYEKIPNDTKHKFLCYKKVEVLFLNIKLLKNTLGVIFYYQNHYKDMV